MTGFLLCTEHGLTGALLFILELFIVAFEWNEGAFCTPKKLV